MATEPLNNDGARVLEAGVWRIPARETDPPRRIPDRTVDIDPIQALIELGETVDAPIAGGLADQLLAWIAPRPRNPATLTQSRIVPLLGVAADILTHGGNASGDIIGLGATALAQELRMQRALAERRATLLPGSER